MKKILVLWAIILLSPGHFIFANFEISEVLYDLKSGSDTGREWIEVYNNSEIPQDFTDLKFFEADTNHKLTLSQGEAKVSAHGYVIIVSDQEKFKNDWPNFTGNIFDSTFSLNNSGELVALKNGDEIVDQYFYKSSFGGGGDGKSLQKINGAWVASLPTPGAENKITILTQNIPKEEKIVAKNSVVSKISEKISEKVQPEVINLAENDENSENESKSFYIFASILVLLIATGTGAVYFIRTKKIAPDKAENFEILED